jgi:integrase/recombinase XerD
MESDNNFSGLFLKFQDYLLSEKCVATNTLEAYKRDIEQFLDFVQKEQGLTELNQITSEHVKEFLKQMRHNMGLGAKSASRKLSAIKTFANYLARYHDFIPFTQGVMFPQLPKQLPRHLTQEQMQTLFQAADQDGSILGQRNKVMLSLLYVCGVRVSELVEMKTTNLNFQEHCLQVSGKGGKERIIPLPPELILLLQAYLSRIHGHLLGTGKKQLQSEYLFPILYAGKVDHITRQAFWRIVKDIAKKSGLMHAISPHTLRHSLATHLLKRGANLRHLQTLLGHEKINTVQVYTHLELSHLRDLYDKYHLRA